MERERKEISLSSKQVQQKIIKRFVEKDVTFIVI
jgi:hypothetical protein